MPRALPLPPPEENAKAEDVYKSSTWLRSHLCVTERILTRMLSYGAIRVLTNVGEYPHYNLADVKAYLRKNGFSDEETKKQLPAPTPRKRATPSKAPARRIGK